MIFLMQKLMQNIQEIKEIGLYLKNNCKNYVQNLKCNVKRMCNLFLSFKLSLVGCSFITLNIFCSRKRGGVVYKMSRICKWQKLFVDSP